MLVSFASQSIAVVVLATIDDRGTTVPDWTATPTSETTVAGCLVTPGASAEVTAARQGVSIKWTALAPPETAVNAHNAVRFGGVLYEVDGEPERWPSPTGALDHVVIYLVEHTG